MASKWTLPKILLGCFVVLVLGCAGIGAAIYFLAPQFIDMFKAEFNKAMEWEQFAQTWQPPPADAGADQLFPAKVGDYQRGQVDANAQVPELEIALPGHRAVYQNGAQTVELFVYRATQADQKAILQRVEKIMAQGSSMHLKTETGTNARLTFTRGKEKGILWWSRDWLFFARGQEPADPEKFLRTYLEALSKPAEAPKEPPKPKT